MGRPREFDLDEALDQALHVFWKKGYEGTSLSDLTDAMGINRPSLYCAFGNKESLFRKVLDHYEKGPAAYLKEALGKPTAREVVESLLRGAVEIQTRPGTPRGCLSVQGALACGDESNAIREEMIARRTAGETAIRQRLERAKSDGDLSAAIDVADFARYIAAMINGTAVLAVGGASREELLHVVDFALRAWPA